MLCEQCGAELEPNARFCEMCGSQVGKTSPMDSKALFQQARDAHSVEKDVKKAAKLYERVTTEYPSSEEAELSRTYLDNIRQRMEKGKGRAEARAEAELSTRSNIRGSTAEGLQAHPGYISTYRTARRVAELISAIGWILSAIGALVALISLLPILKGYAGVGGAVLMFSLGGAMAGLLLVSMGQITRAAVDTADHTGEMLAIMKANNK